MTYPQRLTLWRAQQRYLKNGVVLPDRFMGSIPVPALQRLARMGAILPGMFQSRELRELAGKPLADAMEVPLPFKKVDLAATPLKAWFDLTLSKLGSLDERRPKRIWSHLAALQSLYSTELAGTE